jgi:hypothetical protein
MVWFIPGRQQRVCPNYEIAEWVRVKTVTVQIFDVRKMTHPEEHHDATHGGSFRTWPAELLAWFEGTSLVRKIGFTASIITLDVTGRIGTSLVGAGELYAPDERSLCFALWGRSRAAGALGASGRATVTFVFDGTFYQVHFDVKALPSKEALDAGLSCFRGLITNGETQRVPYAHLTSGITFTLEDSMQKDVLIRWQAQLDLLKASALAGEG